MQTLLIPSNPTGLHQGVQLVACSDNASLRDAGAVAGAADTAASGAHTRPDAGLRAWEWERKRERERRRL